MKAYKNSPESVRGRGIAEFQILSPPGCLRDSGRLLISYNLQNHGFKGTIFN
ncbi:hypothetical protein HMPREF3213_03385 [Heyndrickxia coagulans]|uniref:Uncharacterized protein n=1 Tax=Heyndrickxia coagulans TaxID=1398 RepID=A0A133KCA6_HEYCO|nr:hypothetical protein HMPREF3213_03385 [Heyndrickxia coagulans]